MNSARMAKYTSDFILAMFHTLLTTGMIAMGSMCVASRAPTYLAALCMEPNISDAGIIPAMVVAVEIKTAIGIHILNILTTINTSIMAVKCM